MTKTRVYPVLRCNCRAETASFVTIHIKRALKVFLLIDVEFLGECQGFQQGEVAVNVRRFYKTYNTA